MIWLRQLLSDLDYQQDSPTILYVDNQSTISLARNLAMYSRTKHINIYYYFIREHLDKEDIYLEFICINNIIIDIFTKSLRKTQFISFYSQL